MKKLVNIFIIMVSLILTFTLPVLTEEIQNIDCFLKEISFTSPLADPERSGCCSWHGGVCGCSSTGRVICCDGTLSPSCTC